MPSKCQSSVAHNASNYMHNSLIDSMHYSLIDSMRDSLIDSMRDSLIKSMRYSLIKSMRYSLIKSMPYRWCANLGAEVAWLGAEVGGLATNLATSLPKFTAQVPATPPPP